MNKPQQALLAVKHIIFKETPAFFTNSLKITNASAVWYGGQLYGMLLLILIWDPGNCLCN